MTRTNLEKWKFTLDQLKIGEAAGWVSGDYDDSCWLEVDSYTSWQNYDFALEDYEGCGWFRTRFVPQKANCRQILHFNGVGGNAKVFINGIYAGSMNCRYLPFDIDITELIHTGAENVIAVSVDNTFCPEEHLPGGPIVEWVLYGGLTHHVWVDEKPLCYLEHVRVDARGDGSLRTTVRVRNTDEKTVCGRLCLSVEGLACDQEREISVNAGQTGEFILETRDPAARLWSPEEPNLYRFTASLVQENVQDTYTAKIGFRTIRVQGTHILLNDREIYLKGANRYEEFAPYGMCPPAEKIREDLLTMKSLGMNIVRTHYPQDPMHLEIADEIGIMFMMEVPVNWWAPKKDSLDDYAQFRDEAIWALDETWRYYCNYPSWTVWSVGNECPHSHPAVNALLRLLAQRMRALDCGRIVTYAISRDILNSEELDFCDFLSINNYSGTLSERSSEFSQRADPVIQARMEQALTYYPNLPHAMTEFGVGTIYGVHGSPDEGRFCEEFGAAYVKRACQGYRKNPNMRGLIIWSWADYRHRRGFTPDNTGSSNMHFNATYGPFGVVTMDRKIKKPMAEMLSGVYTSFVPGKGEEKV